MAPLASFEYIPYVPFCSCWYRVLGCFSFVPRLFPTIFAVSSLILPFDWLFLVRHPLGSLFTIFISVAVHEVGHIVVLSVYGQPIRCSIYLTRVELKYGSEDNLVALGGITFLFLVTCLLAPFIGPYSELPLLLCLWDSLPLPGHDGAGCSKSLLRRAASQKTKWHTHPARNETTS